MWGEIEREERGCEWIRVDEIRKIEEKIMHTWIVIVSLLVYVCKQIDQHNK